MNQTTTQATPVPAADDGIPMFLKRETAKSAPALKAAQVEKTAAKAARKEIAAKTPKAPKPAKQVKAAAPKAKHKPSDIVRTEANPAKSIVPVRFKQAYAEHDGTNGDKVAYAVTAAITTKNDDGRTVLSDKLLRELAEANGIDYSKYAHLNMGQRSMNVRNRLRGILKSGKTITVGKAKFADPKKALAKPEAAGAEA